MNGVNYAEALVKARRYEIANESVVENDDLVAESVKDAIKYAGPRLKSNVGKAVDNVSSKVGQKIADANADKARAAFKKAKENSVEATKKAALDAMKAAAASELAKQAAYAELTQKSFDDVKVALDALKAKTDKEVKETINGADFQAKLAAAKRNYAALTAGQKSLYDGGYAAGAAGLSFAAQKTAGILEAIELELQIIALNKAVSTSNAANVKAAADALAKLAEKELYTGVKADTLITTASVAKLDALKVAKALVEVKIETAKINEAYNAYTALDADKKAIVEESFKNVVFGDLKGIDAYKAAKLDQVAKNAAAAFKANEEKTLVLKEDEPANPDNPGDDPTDDPSDDTTDNPSDNPTDKPVDPNPSEKDSGCKKDVSMVIISLISLSSLLVLIRKRK